jgi:hypothetical protein
MRRRLRLGEGDAGGVPEKSIFLICCDAHSASEMGQSATKNHVRDDGSFPRKRSPGVGDGCTADHCQPGLLFGVGTCTNCGRWGWRPWHLQRADFVAKVIWEIAES